MPNLELYLEEESFSKELHARKGFHEKYVTTIMMSSINLIYQRVSSMKIFN